MYDQFLYLASSALNISHYITLHRLHCFYILQVNNMVRGMIVQVLYRVFVFVYSTKNNIFCLCTSHYYQVSLKPFQHVLWGLGNKFAFATTISVIAFYCTAADFTFSFFLHSIFFLFLFFQFSPFCYFPFFFVPQFRLISFRPIQASIYINPLSFQHLSPGRM